MANVLTFTPTFGGAMRAETVGSVSEAIDAFDGTANHEVSYHNPHGPGDWRNVQAQFERAWGLCLAGGYDALWLVEHDMQVPRHALQTMYYTNAPVVYGVYLFRHKSWTLSAFRYDNDVNVGISLMQYPAELEQAWQTGEWDVSGAGFGCKLIRRDVLERIKPRGGTEADRYPDLPFARDCVQQHVRQVARMDVQCLHWCEDVQMWLHPKIHSVGKLMLVDVLQSVNLNAQGQTVRLVAGEQAELPEDVAHDAERAGFVRVVASAAEVKAETMADEKPAKRAQAKSKTK